jgi:hypothetical protein
MVADCRGNAWQGNQSYNALNVCKGMVCASHLLVHSQIEGYRGAACSVVGYARLMTGVLLLCCAVLSCRVQSEQQTLANLQQHLQQLQQAKGQKLAMFGAHAKLRRIVDQKM